MRIRGLGQLTVRMEYRADGTINIGRHSVRDDISFINICFAPDSGIDSDTIRKILIEARNSCLPKSAKDGIIITDFIPETSESSYIILTAFTGQIRDLDGVMTKVGLILKKTMTKVSIPKPRITLQEFRPIYPGGNSWRAVFNAEIWEAGQSREEALRKILHTLEQCHNQSGNIEDYEIIDN